MARGGYSRLEASWRWWSRRDLGTHTRISQILDIILHNHSISGSGFAPKRQLYSAPKRVAGEFGSRLLTHVCSTRRVLLVGLNTSVHMLVEQGRLLKACRGCTHCLNTHCHAFLCWRTRTAPGH